MTIFIILAVLLGAGGLGAVLSSIWSTVYHMRQGVIASRRTLELELAATDTAELLSDGDRAWLDAQAALLVPLEQEEAELRKEARKKRTKEEKHGITAEAQHDIVTLTNKLVNAWDGLERIEELTPVQAQGVRVWEDIHSDRTAPGQVFPNVLSAIKYAREFTDGKERLIGPAQDKHYQGGQVVYVRTDGQGGTSIIRSN